MSSYSQYGTIVLADKVGQRTFKLTTTGNVTRLTCDRLCFSLSPLRDGPLGETTRMSSDYTVGDLVAEFLAACGVTTAFGIASVHNIPMLDAIGRRNTIRFMMARGEMGGAHMADGYARVNGGLG